MMRYDLDIIKLEDRVYVGTSNESEGLTEARKSLCGVANRVERRNKMVEVKVHNRRGKGGKYTDFGGEASPRDIEVKCPTVRKECGKEIDYEPSKPVLRIIDLAEEIAGLPIEIMGLGKEVLPAEGSISIRRERIYIFYRKEMNPGFIDAVVAHECGHAIRILGVIPERRSKPYPLGDEIFELARESFIRHVMTEIEQVEERYLSEIRMSYKDIRDRLGVEYVSTWEDIILGLFPEFKEYSRPFLEIIIGKWDYLVDSFYGHYKRFLMCLFSLPQDIRIERWLYEEFEELRYTQLARMGVALEKQTSSLLARTNSYWATHTIHSMFHIMNYAFYDAMSDIIGKDFREPYVGFESIVIPGKRLNAIALEQKRDDHEGDVLTSQAWAKELGIEDWMFWDVGWPTELRA